MTLNIFAVSPVANLIGIVVFFGLLAMPLYYVGEPLPTTPAACCLQIRSTEESNAPRSHLPAPDGATGLAMRLSHITLIVRDLERSTAFYRALGLVPIVHAPARNARFVGTDGDAALSINATGQPALPARVQICFGFADANALDLRVAQLREAGEVFHQLPSNPESPWREARLADPDGHEIRLHHDRCNRLDPPRKIGGDGVAIGSPGRPPLGRFDEVRRCCHSACQLIASAAGRWAINEPSSGQTC